MKVHVLVGKKLMGTLLEYLLQTNKYQVELCATIKSS